MISLSPLPSAHPSCFQPTLVRASGRCYPTFTLAMGRSPRFASNPSDSSPISDSLSLRLAQRLASPLRKTSRLIMQKARGQALPGRTPAIALPLLVGIRFQVLFHSPHRGAFHLSLTVLVHYRSQARIYPWEMVLPVSRRVPRVPRYSGTGRGSLSLFAYGAITLYRRSFQIVRLRNRFLTPRHHCSSTKPGPATPPLQRLQT